MSKINAIRIINLNYNNNAIKISDEIFEMDGQSTLLSLQNGGGKSVLVQMMLAPFVHKRYLNAKDRPFDSYFTTNKPTFIMVEWKLDKGAGYVLTGMMVRKNQEIAEENTNSLEMINFISEYKGRCQQDLYHLAVVEKTKKEVVLKSFGACKQLFDTCKREREIPFYYFDMNNSAQMKQYFDKLMEYQINYKEWETIIKKINLEESGLSKLFQDCKDEKGLVEKWFLEAVENKLNKEKNRIQEFQSITEKYVVQYKDNQSKILRRDAIKSFEAESEIIKREALSYQEVSQKKQYQEEKIADFISKIKVLLDQENENQNGIVDKIEELYEQINHLEYEKISGEIYEIQKEIRKSTSNWDLLQMEKDDLENALSKIEEKLHILICAKQQKQLDMDNQEYEIEAQKLSLCNTKKQDLEPERNLLGGQLKSYYSSLVLNQEQKAKCCHKNVELLKANEAEAKQTKSELEKAEKEIVSELGGIKASISGYDATEERYNHKYHTSLGRNILGIYEPGLFTVTNQQYRKQLEDAEHNRMTIRRSLEDNKDKFKNIQRTISDQENTKTAKKIACNAETEKLKTFDEEIRERKTILHYFNLGEEVLFDIEEILSQSARKIRETELARNALAIEANTLQKEFKRLTQGQVLELSEEFKKMLDEAGISYVYGMEWLLKNQNSVLENQKLVETHPFLPYALILSNQEIKRLQELQENVYTSFPVPILVRESLEKIMNPASSALRQFEGVSFYLWFNENLLDEDKLSVMVKEKELEIKKINESIKRKSNEYSEYFEKQERIRNQKVTKAAYEEVQNAISQLREQLQVLDQELTNKRTELENVEQTINEQEKSIHRLDEGILQQKQQLQDFEQLEVDYHKYEEYCSLLENKKKEQERIQNQQGLCEEKIQKLQSQIITIQNDINMLETDLKENREKQVKYEQYEPGEAALPEKIVDIENRYLAITSELSVEQQELEHRVEQAVNRRNSSMEELEHLATKYHLTSDMWEEIRYDRKEESHQEIDRENKLIKIKQRQNMINDERVILEGYKTKEQLKKEELKKQCGTEELLPREEIKTINFDAEIKEKNYQKKELEKQQNTIQKKIQGYEELMTALVEYEEFTCSNVINWEIDLSELTSKELTQQKGILIRDYNSYCSDINKKRADLERQLERVRQMEQFADAFYQKPIDTLLNLTADAALVLKQLETILQSFQSLMEKLLVDISFVEKERDKVVELMEEYIKEVHQELGKIDHNSTITIRDKAVKMLKIGLQEWEENESMYQLRLQDYIDDVTQKGVAILDENHNVAEFLGTRITTKALYDAVIGIANVQIRMYKIEAQREYPITWSDVAKNSGGEGFLSAFVILASLLYYMRKDDSDIFADRNEGKVLIMDNPFAQTNASHLLKPLMDMAKKTNTQLICLTGLGGESIYNRFDNIYVLTLIAANLRNGMQYLKSEHMRGSEEETMIVSKFEVMEQQELIF